MQNKNILVGVTGSIAIYKTLELMRLFVKAGANVRVIMSEEAKRFITPLTFEAISQHEVLHVQTESWSNDNNHIYIGKWADIFVLAPASANTINKIANGIADNLLTSTLLAFNKKVILAPSANTNMIINPITQESLAKLEKRGFIISAPQDKLLACNDKGIGAMSEPQDIFNLAKKTLTCKEFWKDKEVIITGGGTIEKIDNVRCLTNFSSGKTANALAKAFYFSGAKVTLITSKEIHSIPKEITIIKYESSKELKAKILEQINDTKKYLFMASAVSDYFPNSYNGKLKKEDLGNIWNLQLQKNEDILSSLPRKNLITIGFKAECDQENALLNAQKMLQTKKLDAVCLNIIGEKNHFGSNMNEITFITKEGQTSIALDTKDEIAKKLLRLVEQL
jgi:phosphopantothenoylcysteine decarboxylase / phosphopantothenate---cysteine ligase